MSGMADVIEMHVFDSVGFACSCGVLCGIACDNLSYPQHVAEELTAAGYGNVQGGNTLNIEIPAEPASGAVLDYTYSPFGNDSEDSPEWHRTMSGDWKGYKDGGKEYASWVDLVRRWGPLTEEQT